MNLSDEDFWADLDEAVRDHFRWREAAAGLEAEALQGGPILKLRPSALDGRVGALKHLLNLLLHLDTMDESLRRAYDRYLAHKEREIAATTELFRSSRSAIRNLVDAMARSAAPADRENLRRLKERDRDHQERMEKLFGQMRLAALQMTQLERTRLKCRRRRLRSATAHAAALLLFSLLVGVVGVELAGSALADDDGRGVRILLAAWAYTLASWALLEFLIEPLLQRLLIKRQRDLVREEVDVTFDAYKTIRINLHTENIDEELPLYATFITT